MCRKFEWQFKRLDESPMNARTAPDGGKLCLITEMPGFPEFSKSAQKAFTFGVGIPITTSAFTRSCFD
jgi:hypothetical protein